MFLQTADTDSSSAIRTHTVKPFPKYNRPLEHTTCRCLPATAGQLQGSTEHYPADVNGSGLVFNPPLSTAPFLSATIVLSTILRCCSTSRTCTHAILLDLQVGTLLEEEEEEVIDMAVVSTVCDYRLDGCVQTLKKLWTRPLCRPIV